MKKIFLIHLIATIVIWNIARAGFKNQGKTGLTFLKVGVGARAAGMGEAFTAVANDAFATYWNPAGLAAAAGSNAALMHNIWLFGIRSEFAAIQIKGKSSSIALHVYTFSVGDIQVRTIPSERPLETTNANYISMGMSYARSFSSNFRGGITVKYLFEKIFIESASGLALDLGIRYEFFRPHLILGGVIQNIGRMSELQQQSTALPVITRIGAMYPVPRRWGAFQFLLATDLVKPLQENLRVHMGGEIQFKEQISLRIGFARGYENHSLSFGVGINRSFFRFDYSLTPFQDNLDNGHRFSVSLAL